MITAGLDIGSRTIKLVFYDRDAAAVLYSTVGDVSTDPAADALAVWRGALDAVGLAESSIARVISTGYGRRSASFAHESCTEITCHAAGVASVLPQARFVVDIGGQDSKAIRIADKGRVLDFVMNDRCAAGTGRFLEVAARILGSQVSELAEMCDWTGTVPEITSMCAVFAESEIISLIARGTPRPAIAAGLHTALASRVGAMARRCGMASPIAFTGGVAQNKAMVQALSVEFDEPLLVPPDPRITGALGAAIIAGR